MRAMIYDRIGSVVNGEVDEPQPSPGETVVSVALAGICGSDVHGISGVGRRKPPLVMGHEMSGWTVDRRRVAINPLLTCGECDFCIKGSDHLCSKRAMVGIDRDGGFAERLTVPESAVVMLSEAVSLQAGALVEPLAVAVRAWDRSGAADGARIGVIGSGNIGLLVLKVAKHHGAEVEVADPLSTRLEVAERHGASRVSASLSGDQYDFVFDAVGTAESHKQSLARVRPGGAAVWIGNTHPDPGFDAIEFVREDRVVYGSARYTRSQFSKAAELAAKLEFDWATVYPLADGSGVFAEIAQHRSPHVKVLLEP